MDSYKYLAEAIGQDENYIRTTKDTVRLSISDVAKLMDLFAIHVNKPCEGEKQPSTEGKCNKHIVSQQRELLVAFSNYCNSFNIENNCILEDDIDAFLSNQ